MVLTDQEIAKKQLDQTDQQLQNDPNAVYAESMRSEKTANLLDQLNPDNLLSDIEQRIRGKRKNQYTNKWEDLSDNPKEISEKLISNFMSFLGAILNQNTSMSNFSADEINNIMQTIISYVANDLETNDEEYGIEEDYPEMTRIGNIILITCFATFKQAMNGGQSKRVFGSMTMHGSLDDQNKNNVANALAFWK